MVVLLVLVAGLYAAVVSCPATAYVLLRDQCEPLSQASYCHGLGYNTTILPNSFGQRYQRRALMHAKQFSPLVWVACSKDVAFFFCSVYFPVCNSLNRPIPPCRSVCLRVKMDCEPVMQSFGFKWPDKLNCGNLPIFGGPQLCVARNTSQAAISPSANKLPKKVKKLTLRKRQKICWEIADGVSKRCCRQGLKAAKMNYTGCSLDIAITKTMPAKERRYLRRAKKDCASSSYLVNLAKSCYSSCCEHYRKKQSRSKKKVQKLGAQG